MHQDNTKDAIRKCQNQTLQNNNTNNTNNQNNKKKIILKITS